MAKSERIGEGVVSDGVLQIYIDGPVGPESYLLSELPGSPISKCKSQKWRQAWERYKEKWPIEYNVVNAVGGDSPWQSRVPDGPVYLVRWECERCHGTYIGCGGCNETGYVYEIEPKGDNE
jgi:hypothetical protein